MGTTAGLDLFGNIWSDAGWDRDPTSDEETSIDASAEREVSEELGREFVDEGFDEPDDYREYGGERRAYANSVGMRLWEKV